MILGLGDDVSLETAGGKGANLARLVRAGFCVPRGFIIPTRAYREHLAANDLAGWVLDAARAARAEDGAALEATSATIRARFAGAAMQTTLVASIGAAYEALGRPSVAVRSSATTEDLPDLSFAGQQDTFLNVAGDAALLDAVVRCWSSLWTARAIAYRARNDIPHEAAALAVVVQEMVASEVAGVLFTANPVTGKRSETVIEAVSGLGEALVSGRVTPDRYIIDTPMHRVVRRTLAGDRETLSERDALELTNVGQRIVELFETPQDIEWARAGGQLHVLQARPITSLFPLPVGLPDDRLHVLVSANAIQGMLDPITPLGTDVFRVLLPSALRSIGGPVARARPSVIAGERWFLDVTGMLRRKRIRGLVRDALRVIEPTTGEALDDLFKEVSLPRADSRAWLRVLSPRFLMVVTRALGNLTYDILWPDRGRERVQRRVAAAVDVFRKRAIEARTLEERVQLMQQTFAWVLHSGLPLLMPALGTGLGSLRILHAFAAGLPDGERRVLELTRGLPHNTTTEMDLALWDVARAIRRDPDSRETAVDAFLQKYGMRGVGEIDLGRPRWREDRTTLLQALDSYLQIDDDERAPDVVFRRGAEAAQRALESLITDVRRSRVGHLKAFVMRRAAWRMRALAGLRETPKFTVISILDSVRAALLVSGKDLAASGVVERPDDIFFLYVEELKAIAAGDTRDWRSVVHPRRRVYAFEMRRRRIPRVLLSDGRAFFAGAGAGDRVSASALSGTPVSPGIVVGAVRVVSDPARAALVPGEILVCRGTDPAWTPLFLAASGLVTEVGGLMTHGAVVAREYGIPAVVGVHDATTLLHTGDRIRLDGTTGSVVVLEGARSG